MDEQQLWAAVLANPDAMEPRRALATLWGGDREKFVVGQLEASAAMRRGLKGRSLETDRLLDGHVRAWAGPIVDRVHEARFLRGAVEWVVVDAAQFVREWRALLALAPIRHLDVVKVAPVVDEFFASPGLAQIVGLSFNLAGTPLYSEVGPGLATALVKSPHLRALRYLDLENTGLDETAKAAITHATNLPALEVLKLDGLSEDIGQDWDGTIVEIRPSQELHDFEQRHGRCEWLHAAERTKRPVTREAF